MIKILNKLVRDKIVEKIETRGEMAEYKILSDEEYRTELIAKMHEETNEFDNDNTLAELGDMYGVLCAIVEHSGYTMEDVIKTAKEKEEKNGGFKKKIFLQSWNERGILR